MQMRPDAGGTARLTLSACLHTLAAPTRYCRGLGAWPVGQAGTRAAGQARGARAGLRRSGNGVAGPGSQGGPGDGVEAQPLRAESCGGPGGGLPRPLRYAVVALVVGLYVTLGFLLRPGTNWYLLMGIPITLLFQLLVARRPLRELWLRGGSFRRADRWTIAWLALCLIGPALTVVEGVRAGDWSVTVYGFVALAGAGGAAVCLRRLTPAQLRQLGLVLGAAVLVGAGRVALDLALHSGTGATPPERLREGLESTLFYLAAVFVVEEVFFRGALDSYLHRTEHGPGWASAVFVSLLWGVWHLPTTPSLSAAVVVQVLVFQLAIGVALSWLWRQSGNLALPGGAHAILDGVRNALLA